jgi:hypothetical protein
MIGRKRRLCVVLLSGVLLLAGTVWPGVAAEFTQKELAYMPATLQIELFKRGTISPVDVLKAQKAEYDRTEEKVNAVTVAYFDNAMKMAEASAKRYADGSYRPLEGITVGIKDEHYDKGWVVTQGSLRKLGAFQTRNCPARQTAPGPSWAIYGGVTDAHRQADPDPHHGIRGVPAIDPDRRHLWNELRLHARASRTVCLFLRAPGNAGDSPGHVSVLRAAGVVEVTGVPDGRD